METLIVVRHSHTAFNEDGPEGLLARLRSCLVMGGRILWRRTFLSLDGCHMVCEFDAPDAESLRLCFRSSGVPFTGIWTARVFAPSKDPNP
jgi:hypothetical protein